jgi:hypothetical protein
MAALRPTPNQLRWTERVLEHAVASAALAGISQTGPHPPSSPSGTPRTGGPTCWVRPPLDGHAGNAIWFSVPIAALVLSVHRPAVAADPAA